MLDKEIGKKMLISYVSMIQNQLKKQALKPNLLGQIFFCIDRKIQTILCQLMNTNAKVDNTFFFFERLGCKL